MGDITKQVVKYIDPGHDLIVNGTLMKQAENMYMYMYALESSKIFKGMFHITETHKMLTEVTRLLEIERARKMGITFNRSELQSLEMHDWLKSFSFNKELPLTRNTPGLEHTLQNVCKALEKPDISSVGQPESANSVIIPQKLQELATTAKDTVVKFIKDIPQQVLHHSNNAGSDIRSTLLVGGAINGLVIGSVALSNYCNSDNNGNVNGQNWVERTVEQGFIAIVYSILGGYFGNQACGPGAGTIAGIIAGAVGGAVGGAYIRHK